jgi:hypothetical protein
MSMTSFPLALLFPPMMASIEKELDQELVLPFLEMEEEGDVCTVVVGDPFMMGEPEVTGETRLIW